MNPSLSHDLQFLNYLEVFGHRHGAAALRKAMHLSSELAPAGETQDKLAKETNPMAPDRPGYVPENWGWPSDDEGAMGVVDGRNLPNCSVEELIARNRRAEAKQKNVEVACQMMGHVLGLHMQLETAKLGCLLNPNLTPEALDEIFLGPKHRFIKLDGSPREEACCK